MIYIGIDPGKKGAFACINTYLDDDLAKEGSCIFWDEEKFIIEMKFIATHYPLAHERLVVLEKVHSMPTDGHVGAFKFGTNVGFIAGVLGALNIPFVQVTPQKWKKEFDLIGKDKKASIEKCKELFPLLNLRRTGRCTTDSDGMAEAMLICEYGRRHYKELMDIE